VFISMWHTTSPVLLRISAPIAAAMAGLKVSGLLDDWVAPGGQYKNGSG
jgi:hypothetical protein